MNPEFKPALSNTGLMSQQSFFSDNDHDHLQAMFTTGLIAKDSILNIVKPDPGMDDYWVGTGSGVYSDHLGYGYLGQNTVLKVTNPSEMVADHTLLHGNSSSALVSPKKTKADEGQTLQVVSEKEKKIKGCSEDDSKITRHNSSHNKNSNTNNNRSNKETSSKDKSKVSVAQKTDYIHVRARRGQATDSHSLAERVRREKISERMKYLQDLVPGCNKIVGKAGMLDEIINYVQSLQKQVEFLSMKLAAVNPELDFNFDNVLTKEMFQSLTSEFPALTCSSTNSAYFDQLNSLDQAVSFHGLDMGINSGELGLRRSKTAKWDADLQNLYKMEFEQGALMPFQSHQFTAGSNEVSNLKMET